MRTRRKFLQRASAGLLGLFAFFFPQKLSARHRCRSASACCPTSPTIPAEPVVGTQKGMKGLVAGDFIIDFPDETSVHGKGGFYTWGTTVNLNIRPTGATCGGQTGTSVQAPGAVPANSWAYRFDNVGTAQVTLTINGMNYTNPMKPVPANPTSFTFTPVSP